MKKMNRIAAFALAATIGLGSMTAMADDNVKKNEAARDRQTACCLQGITLTEKQKAEIAALQASKQKELQARRDQRDKDRQQKAGMRQSERKNYLAEMKKILTPEQYVQMLENNFVNGRAMRADGRKFDNGRKNSKDRERKNDRMRGVGRQQTGGTTAASGQGTAL